jgi:hypothetical protein
MVFILHTGQDRAIKLTEGPRMDLPKMIHTPVLALECPWAIGMGAGKLVHHYVRDSENKVSLGVSDGCASVGNRER